MSLPAIGREFEIAVPLVRGAERKIPYKNEPPRGGRVFRCVPLTAGNLPVLDTVLLLTTPQVVALPLVETSYRDSRESTRLVPLFDQ